MLNRVTRIPLSKSSCATPIRSNTSRVCAWITPAREVFSPLLELVDDHVIDALLLQVDREGEARRAGPNNEHIGFPDHGEFLLPWIALNAGVHTKAPTKSSAD
ncbi:MAG: hypothetical protein R2724_16480 [Bryobacterales bacterium]